MAGVFFPAMEQRASAINWRRTHRLCRSAHHWRMFALPQRQPDPFHDDIMDFESLAEGDLPPPHIVRENT
jgi:hypothetical protein